MTKKELPARAANLQRAIASSATCTSATVEALRAFLLPAEHPTSLREQSIARDARSHGKVASQTRLMEGRTKRRPPVALLEIPSAEEDQKQAQEKILLATEVVNVTLKELTNAIKSPPTQKRRAPFRRMSSGASFSNRSGSRSQTPLQPLCINRLSTISGEKGHLRRSSSTASLDESPSGLRAQAECGHIAFSTLRLMQTKNLSPKIAQLQLESGMSALIGKLITLGFEDLAVKELRILRRRLQSSSDPINVETTAKLRGFQAKRDEPPPKVETLANMLSFSNYSAQGQLLALIITTQLQILKIIALRKEPQLISAALRHLRLDVSYSPAILLQRQIEFESPASCDKAAHQLESFAQSLLALCPNTSSVADSERSKLSHGLPAETILEIQMLAMRVRRIWWSFSSHDINIASEVIGPFNRYLSAFHRRCLMDTGSKHSTAKAALEIIADYICGAAASQQKDLALIYRLMADIAQEDGQYLEAIDWIEKIGDCTTECDMSQARLCSLHCRLACLRLRLHGSDPGQPVLDALMTAATGLAGNLQGDSRELDELLFNVASLRRSTFSLFQGAHQPSNAEFTQISSAVIAQCSEIVLLCSKFVLRYIGRAPNQRENEKTRARSEQRRRLASQVTTPIIESVAAVARLSAKATIEGWGKIDGGLRDSFALALSVDEVGLDNSPALKGSKHDSGPFVSLSNAYWFRYLYLKQQPADAKSARDCLRTSIDLIQGRSSSEQIAGLLPMKLEKYAQCCESMRDYKRATGTYEEALHTQVNFGHLQAAGEAAEVKSLPNALDRNSELGVLARLLLAYPRAAARAAIKHDCVKPFFDIEELGLNERGVLLEQQLISLLSMVQDQALASITASSLNSLTKVLLAIYTDDSYPIRRFRVVVRLLALMSSTSEALDDELRLLIRNSPCTPKKTHLDTTLLLFLPHLVTSQEILNNIHQGIFDVRKVEAVLETWLEMLHKNPEWESLQTRVYDMSDWLSLLDTIAEYLDLQGMGLTRVTALHILVSVHEASESAQSSDLVSKLSALGRQYARLGYSGKASVVLRRARRYMEASDIAVEVALQWHLNYAEHALYIGDTKRCGENLKKAHEIFKDRLSKDKFQTVFCRDRRKCSLLIADACYVHSLLAAAEGQSMKALYFGRLSVKSYQRSWASLEKDKEKTHEIYRSHRMENTNDVLPDSISELSITEHRSIESEKPAPLALIGAAFWSLAPRLIHGFIHLSHVFAHHGLFQEVRYYLNQAKAIAETVKSSAFVGQHNSLLGQYLIRGGKSHEGLTTLQNAEGTLINFPHDQHYIRLQLSLARYYVENGHREEGLSALHTAEETLQKLMEKKSLDGSLYQRLTFKGLDSQLAALTLQDAKPVKQPQNRPRQANSKKTAIKPTVKSESAKPAPGEIPAVEAIALSRTKNELLRERIRAASCEGSLDSAIMLLDEAAPSSEAEQGLVLQALLTTQIRFGQAIKQLVSDPVFCVLPESTIAYPSLKSGDERQRSKNSPCKPGNVGTAVSVRNQQAKGMASKRRPRSPLRCKFDISLLDQAQSALYEAYKLAKTHSMMGTVHEITRALGKILIMLSATSSRIPNPPGSSTFMAYILETSRILSMVRESTAIHVEQRLLHKKATYEWPEEDASEGDEHPHDTQNLDLASFQTDYIDIIPSGWTALSMTLSETREEILICKIRAGQAPLVLRLPLNRSNSMESEEESFGFDEGKAELQDIIRLTNESTHGAQNLSQKGAKTKWWDTRIALDARLKDLLANIENIWLGGFRGIFAQEAHNQGLLARLQQSLQKILDKHLPSRQKVGSRNQPPRLTFDLRILELFVGLGNPSETHDIDEPLMDLLYFIVDILQFHGERNAYDEIDFDSIAVEITDALRQYHQAVCNEGAGQSEQHTILILDSHLHCFPWESLPCLRGQAVSRLPSLGCLRDRIRLQRGGKGDADDSSLVGEKMYVKKNAGASILNPGGDLESTQAKFEEPLQRLTSWEAIVQKEPTESEMKNILESQEILLYFGHGSGGQYIRSRTIKKLDRCAVALLMGCSSGTLTEAGDFESYGTPINYMHAGSPAVLATLWDVTDKDIDRFSQTVLEEWGLFPKTSHPLPSSPVKKSAKQRGKSKVNHGQDDMNGERLQVSLDEAVSRGRDSCILKYLNGAAPVVYGVPVFLA